MNLKDKVYIIDIIENNRFKVFKFNIILIKIIFIYEFIYKNDYIYILWKKITLAIYNDI